MSKTKNSATEIAEPTKTDLTFKDTRTVTAQPGLIPHLRQGCQAFPRFTGNSSTKSEFSNTVCVFCFFPNGILPTTGWKPATTSKNANARGRLGLVCRPRTPLRNFAFPQFTVLRLREKHRSSNLRFLFFPLFGGGPRCLSLKSVRKNSRRKT